MDFSLSKINRLRRAFTGSIGQAKDTGFGFNAQAQTRSPLTDLLMVPALLRPMYAASRKENR